MTGSLVVMKANVVPVRALTLERLARELELRVPARVLGDGEEPQSGVVVATPEEGVREAWLKLLHVLGEITKEYAELARVAVEGRGAGAEEVLRTYVDLLAYALRWPLYLHPLPPVVLSPHVALALKPLVRLLCGEVGLDFREHYLLAQALASTREGAKLIAEDRVVAKLWRVCRYPEGKEQMLSEAITKHAVRLLELVTRELPKVLEYVLYSVPADTRPGLNVSSLLLHDLLASAATLSLALRQAGPGGLLRDALRLAALLHDIGKPVDYERHYEASARAAESLLEPLVKVAESENMPELAEALRKVVEAVRYHHLPEECRRRLGEPWTALCRVADGDSWASALDRLSRVIVGALDESACEGDELCVALSRMLLDPAHGGLDRGVLELLAEKLREAFGSGPCAESASRALRCAYRLDRPVSSEPVWSAWRKVLSEDEGVRLAKALSEAMVRLLARPFTLFKLQKEAPPARSELCALVVDVGGIQASIRESAKLRSLAGASLLIDYVTMVALPEALELALGLPLETVVFAGGGSLAALASCGTARRARAEDLEKALLHATNGYAKLALPAVKVRVGWETIPEAAGLALYGVAVAQALSKLAAQKLQPVPASELEASAEKVFSPAELVPGAELCELCHRRFAVARLESGERACLPCLLRYELAEPLGYSRRARAAGVELIEPTEALTLLRGSKLAVLKADGNAMGLMMYSCLTPSVFFEKSVRIDLALKRAVSRVYEAVEEVKRSAEGEPLRSWLGALEAFSFLYAGGDDLLMVLPHDASFAAAALIAYEFAAETGFRASLSVGVAAAPRTQPLWWLLEAAEKLLSEAKSRVRGESVKAVARYPDEVVESCGAVLYDFAAGTLTPLRACKRLEARLAGAKGAPAVPLLIGRGPTVLNLLRVLSPSAVTRSKGFPVRAPDTKSGDEDVEQTLGWILRSSLRGSAEAGEAMRFLSRCLALAPRPALLPHSLASKAVEEGGAARRAAAELLKLLHDYASLTGSPVDDRIVEKLFHELYLASKLLGG